jgi:hypothetical protein
MLHGKQDIQCPPHLHTVGPSVPFPSPGVQKTQSASSDLVTRSNETLHTMNTTHCGRCYVIAVTTEQFCAIPQSLIAGLP